MKAILGENENFEIIRSKSEPVVNLNGENFPIDLLQAGNKFHAVWKGKSVNVEVVHVNKEEKKVALIINGKKTEIQLQDPLDSLLSSLGFSSTSSSKVKQVKSPMPGLVLAISVEVGQAVKKDDALLILEAMKMENVIKSQGEGVVKQIQVKAGDAVEKGHVMIIFE